MVNAVVTLLWINPSATQGFRVLRAWAGVSGTPAAGQQRIQIVTQVTAFPTVVSATPRAHSFLGPTSGIVGGTTGAAGTCGVNASAEGAGAKTIRLEDQFNVQVGWLYVPTEKEIWEFPAANASGLGIYLPVAAVQLTNWVVGLTYEEMG